MIILRKKRIILMLACVIVSVCFFNMSLDNSKKAIPVVSLPVSNKVIVLDAGHGDPDRRSGKCKWCA